MTDAPSDAPSPGSPPLETRREGPILVLTLHRPERLNAVTLPLYRALSERLDEAARDPEVRCVVLAGAGRAFCVGADLKAHASGPPDGALRRAYVAAAQEANRRIQLGPVPVVAAVHGHAIGAGLELALSADFAVVAEEAKLRFPELLLGTFVGGGTVYTLAERVGTLKARELLYLGEFFSGREAAAWGVAWRALAAARVLEEAMSLARRLSERAPRSLAWAKRLVGPAGTLPRARALALEARALEEAFGTHDWQEGLDAFREKRTPRFTGQ